MRIAIFKAIFKQICCYRSTATLPSGGSGRAYEDCTISYANVVRASSNDVHLFPIFNGQCRLHAFPAPFACLPSALLNSKHACTATWPLHVSRPPPC